MIEVTVTEHLLIHQKLSPSATGMFTYLLNDLILSAKIISRSVSKAGLVDILGGTGDINVQGEKVQKLDELANRILIYRMERSGALCAMASEENADFIPVSDEFPKGDYILIFDPLDGSTNIDCNVNVGTIFSIFRRPCHMGENITLNDILQQGSKQLAAGYILYGPSTMLVYTTGRGVHGFTLDPSVGEFLLSHADIKIPESGKIYSVNESNSHYWSDATRKAVNWFKSIDTPWGEPYSLRYVGSLVADFHRTLLYGGIYMYPADSRCPEHAGGKLRLMCECFPLAFLVEQAGGKATDGKDRILDKTPDALHARSPFFIGSAHDVDMVGTIYKEARLAQSLC